jgi:hypothetical protein
VSRRWCSGPRLTPDGRASVFLGSVLSGLVALGFSSQGDRGSAGFVAFAALILTALVFLGVVTFARTVQSSIDDAVYADRIEALRDSYAQLVPDLAAMLAVVRGGDLYQQRVTRRGQRLLTVSGSIGVLTSLLVGGDVGLLINAGTQSLPGALGAGVITGIAAAGLLLAHQSREWKRTFAPRPSRAGRRRVIGGGT